MAAESRPDLKLILHIGTEKTGSTSFQAWGNRNRDRLRDQGVWYSRALGQTNHIAAYVWALDTFGPDDGLRRLGLGDATAYGAFRSALPDKLAQEVDQARAENCHSFVISCELFHSRLQHPQQVENLHRLVSGLFDDITVFCVLRPQIDVGVSHLATRARVLTPVTAQSLAWIRPDNLYFNYEWLVAKWSEVFGPDALRLIPYRTHPDLHQVLARFLNLDITDFVVPPRANTALDIGTIALTNTLSHLPDPEKHSLRVYLRPSLEQLTCTERPNPGHALARQVQDLFHATNADLASGRDDITLADLEPDWSRYDGPGNLDRLEDMTALADHLPDLLRDLQIRNSQLALKLKLLQAERAIERGNLDNATRFLSAAKAETAKLLPMGTDAECDRLRDRVAAISSTLAVARQVD